MDKKLICFDSVSIKNLDKLMRVRGLNRSQAIRVVLAEEADRIDKLLLDKFASSDLLKKGEDIPRESVASSVVVSKKREDIPRKRLFL